MSSFKVSPPQILPRRTVREFRDFMRDHVSPLYELSAIELGLLLDLATPPRPWLKAEEVRESGTYWWRQDDEYAIPVSIYVMKSGTDGSCFASAGQLGWRQSRAMKELGGLWQRIPEPELPEGES